MNLPENWDKIVPGLKIYPLEGCDRAVFPLGDSWFAYVQHDHIISDSTGRENPNHGKLMVRDGRWNGALKAFVTNWSKSHRELEYRIDHLIVLKMSASGKSVITKAVFKSR